MNTQLHILVYIIEYLIWLDVVAIFNWLGLYWKCHHFIAYAWHFVQSTVRETIQGALICLINATHSVEWCEWIAILFAGTYSSAEIIDDTPHIISTWDTETFERSVNSSRPCHNKRESKIHCKCFVLRRLASNLLFTKL